MVSIEFEAATGDPLRGELLYRIRDHALDFEICVAQAAEVGAVGAETASLALSTLQLETGSATGRVLFPWGYCVWESMRTGVVTPVSAIPGILRVKDASCLESGMSFALGSEKWFATRDAQSGWLQISTADVIPSTIVGVEFASGCIAILEATQLVALQLYPRLRL